jgi:carnosine N-methyltransferase
LTRNAFKVYQKSADLNIISPRRKRIGLLNDRERALTLKLQLQLDELEKCVSANQTFIDKIVQIAVDHFVPDEEIKWSPATAIGLDKVRSTLRQVAREWSEDGKLEREKSYGRVVEELCQCYPDRKDRHQVRILVPGCGLGRLPFDLAYEGFQAQGNEFSYHMLFTSNLILNSTSNAFEHVLHPYIHNFSNLRTRQDQTKQIRIPDISPHTLSQHYAQDPDIPEDGLLSMTAGSFTQIYPMDDQPLFDAVATIFFIDATPNIFKTLSTISASLKPGGLWINFGPLLWHYEDMLPDDEDEDSSCGLEHSLEDLIDLIPHFGFRFIKRQSEQECTYTRPPASMVYFNYQCEYWVAEKI